MTVLPLMPSATVVRSFGDKQIIVIFFNCAWVPAAVIVIAAILASVLSVGIGAVMAPF